MKIIQSIIKPKKKGKKFKTNLKERLSKDIVFSEIDSAGFYENMVLGTVKFDKDNTIYVLVSKDIFKTE